jgi:hypothetical protein
MRGTRVFIVVGNRYQRQSPLRDGLRDDQGFTFCKKTKGEKQ